jgi:uncharacterized protein YaaQ
MKIVLSIVSGDAVDTVSNTLIERNCKVTHIGSMGGFRRRGNSTLIVGVEESRVQDTLVALREACAKRKRSDKPTVTIFVLDAQIFQIWVVGER